MKFVWGVFIGAGIFHIIMQYHFWWWLPLIFLINIPMGYYLGKWFKEIQRWEQLDEQLQDSLEYYS